MITMFGIASTPSVNYPVDYSQDTYIKSVLKSVEKKTHLKQYGWIARAMSNRRYT